MTIALFLISCDNDLTPSSIPEIVRLSRIVIDSAQLENYKALLKEEIETSVKVQPGVLTLYAVFEKDKPTHLTILEIYDLYPVRNETRMRLRIQPHSFRP